LETQYQFGDTAIGALLGLGAAPTRGGTEGDRIAGSGRPTHNISEGEHATESLHDNATLYNLASSSNSVGETSFDATAKGAVVSGRERPNSLGQRNSSERSRMKKKKKWKDYMRSSNGAVKLQLLDADDSTFII
jgi:hypothetical protein